MALELKAANSAVMSNGEAAYYEVAGLPEGHFAVIRHTSRGDWWQLLHSTPTQPCDWSSCYDSKEAALAALATALAAR
jgi:hypothetical protein